MLGAALMFQPETGFADPFTSSDPKSGWTESPESTWSRVIADVCYRSGAGSPSLQDWIYRNGATHTDGWAECVPQDDGIGPVVRGAGDGSDLWIDGYLAVTVAGAIRLFRNSGGTRTQIGSTATTLNLSTDVLRVEAIGTTIRVLKNGTQVISVTDSTLTSGYWGIAVNAAAGDLVCDDYAEGGYA